MVCQVVVRHQFMDFGLYKHETGIRHVNNIGVIYALYVFKCSVRIHSLQILVSYCYLDLLLRLSNLTSCCRSIGYRSYFTNIKELSGNERRE